MKRTGIHGWMMVLTAVLALVAAALIPYVRINSDVTTYLPDDSPMRQGLDIVAENLPGLDIRRQIIRLHFPSDPPSDSLRTAVESLLEDPQLPDIRQSGSSSYFQYSLPRETDGKRLKAAVRERFGDRVEVEIEDNTGMPDHLPRMIGTGFVLMLLILILMSPSLVEALLFMGTIGVAILFNIGSNALLPSVSMITNALSSVLQMALSLDYAIILSNRYRQVKASLMPGSTSVIQCDPSSVIQSDSEESLRLRAMGTALRKAAPSILSSAGTTIASLLMLCFMRLRFGQDFGVVLSKGVLCSLICTFTLLPGLLLLFEKSISRTEKKVPLIPTEGLARFEHRFRIPIAIVFVALLVGSYFLQRRVPVSYSMMRKTAMMQKFPPKNMMLLVYPTAEEDSLIAVLDALQISDADVGQRTDSAHPVRSPYAETGAMHENVQKCALSYPTIALRPRTAGEWRRSYPEMLGEVPPEAMDLLFYAATHPERDERFALNALQIPPEYGTPVDLASLTRFPEGPEDSRDRPGNDVIDKSGNDNPSDVVIADTTSSTPGHPASSLPGSAAPFMPDSVTSSLPDSVVSSLPDSVVSSLPGSLLPSFPGLSRESPYTWAGLHQKRSIPEMNAYLGVETAYLRIVYRMAGSVKGTMSAVEVMDVVQQKILGNKAYAAMIPKGKRTELDAMKRDFDAVLAAGPLVGSLEVTDSRDKPGNDVIDSPASSAPGHPTSSLPDSVTSSMPSHVAPSLPGSATSSMPDSPISSFPGLSRESPATPQEDLAVAALTGERCSAARCYTLLHRAGVKVTRDEVDMLYLYNGFLTAADTTTQLSLNEMLDALDDLVSNPLAAQVLDSTRRAQLAGMRSQLDTQLGLLRSEDWSAAVLLSDLPEEGDSTYAFIADLQSRCADTFRGETYVAGYSVMYDEMRGSFPRELLLVTLLTALVILLIVALTFRRILLPVILVSIVLTAVWLDVWVSGLGGNAILFMAYFIVQSILMGATIDYSILFSHYYRDARKTQDRPSSLKAAYRGSIHTISTSGMIIVLGTGIMMLVVSDPVIVPVLKSISGGSLIAILLILLVLPALLSLTDWRKNR